MLLKSQIVLCFLTTTMRMAKFRSGTIESILDSHYETRCLATYQGKGFFLSGNSVSISYTIAYIDGFLFPSRPC
jgi:hypothetical protein